MMPTGYGSAYQIVQGPGYVAILIEMVHESRMIPLAGRPHVGRAIRSYMGDSSGHWEGTTLVVETTNFKQNDELPKIHRELASDRTLYAHRSGHSRVDRHGR